MPEEETYGCNTIGLPDGKVLVAKGYPTVEKTLTELGLETITLDFSEIRAADGSLTCCSLFYWLIDQILVNQLTKHDSKSFIFEQIA